MIEKEREEMMMVEKRVKEVEQEMEMIKDKGRRRTEWIDH